MKILKNTATRLRSLHRAALVAGSLLSLVVANIVIAQDSGIEPVEFVGTLSPLPSVTADNVLEIRDSVVDIAPITLTGDFTIEAWVRFAEGEAITNSDVLVGSATNNVNFNNGQVRIWDGSINNRSLRDQVVSSIAAVPGEWTHYAIVREAGETRIFVNFSLNATSTRRWNNNFTINEIGRGLHGQIDDVKVSNRAFTEAEILAGTSEGLLRHYSFDTTGTQLAVNENPIPLGPYALTGDFTIQSRVLFDHGNVINNIDGIVASATNDLNFHDGLLRLHDRAQGNGSAGDLVIANTRALPGVWVQYTIIRRNGNLSLLVDGQLDASSTVPWAGDFVISNIGAGIAGLNAGSGLSGTLSDLTLYDFALSQAEVDETLLTPAATTIIDLTGNSIPVSLPAGATIIAEDFVATNPTTNPPTNPPIQSTD